MKNLAFSYTALSTFDTCPRQYHWKYILRNKEPETKATIHGIAVHDALEKRVRDGVALPFEYRAWDKLASSVAELPKTGVKVMTEVELAVDYNLKPCGFWDEGVYMRGKADVLGLRDGQAVILDWKTGKTREKIDQVEIFAGFVFRMFPNVQRVTAANIWLNELKVGTVYNFARSDDARIWTGIIRRTDKINECIASGKFPERQSGLCGWCPAKECVHNANRGG